MLLLILENKNEVNMYNFFMLDVVPIKLQLFQKRGGNRE